MSEEIAEILDGFRNFDGSYKRDLVDAVIGLKEDFERRSLDDIHNCMSWWACFNPESEGLFPEVHPFLEPQELPTKKRDKQKKAKKKKRKT